MSRFSLTTRCVICNKEIAQSGPARQWVHQDGFYSKADHPAEPGGRQPFLMPKKTPVAAPAVEAEAEKPSDSNRAKSDGDLRRRLRQGTADAVDPDDAATRRRRMAALEKPDTGPSEGDLVARKLRMLRQADNEQQK